MILIEESGCAVVKSQSHLGNVGLDPLDPLDHFIKYRRKKMEGFGTRTTRLHSKTKRRY